MPSCLGASSGPARTGAPLSHLFVFVSKEEGLRRVSSTTRQRSRRGAHPTCLSSVLVRLFSNLESAGDSRSLDFICIQKSNTYNCIQSSHLCSLDSLRIAGTLTPELSFSRMERVSKNSLERREAGEESFQRLGYLLLERTSQGLCFSSPQLQSCHPQAPRCWLTRQRHGGKG